MTDRELLGLAATAVGITIAGWTKQGGEEVAVLSTGGYWQPLLKNGITDCDGDALRMAVNLQLTVCNEHVRAGAAYCTRGEDEVFKDAPGAPNGESEVLPEDYAATRRAIVLAAAEIGKAMP